ncbi:hypothetical protein ACLKA6_019285 [Drosophila palustris]
MRVSFKIFILLGLTLFLQLVTTTSIPDKIEPKIVGGYPISIDQAPYQVSVRLTARERRSYGSGHICGGVVISQRLVATAAHCIFNSETNAYRKSGEFVLVMGSASLSTSNAYTQQYYVQEMIVHPYYNRATLENDIALLFFNGYIPWNSPTVRALPLNDQQVPATTPCNVTGWGVTKFGSSFSSETLRLGPVQAVSYTDCKIGYGTLPRSQMCAGYMAGGIDACQGDSGGPLICNNKLAGIVSYGNECALAVYPGIYTNVSFYHDWLIQSNRSLNYSVYKNAALGLKSLGMGLWLTIFGVLLATWQ